LSGTQYLVNSLADIVDSDGVVTLREAIRAANENVAVTADVQPGSAVETDIITFDQSALQAEAGPGNPLVIALSISQLEIIDDLEITGPGQDVLTIDADGQDRVLNIPKEGTHVALTGLTITGGHSGDNGGGIYSQGVLTLVDSTVTGNSAHDGGGIFNMFGTVELVGSTVSDNSAVDRGGGIHNHERGLVTLTGSTVSDNLAGRGGGFYTYAELELVDSTVSGNSAHADGGGIYLNTYGSMRLTSSTVSGNSADHDGGGVYNNSGTLAIMNSVISGNSTDHDGGGIHTSDGGGLILWNSTVAGNSASNAGGGICTSGTVALENTIVAVNEAPNSPDIHGAYTDVASLVGVNPGFVRNPSAGLDGVWGTPDDDAGDVRIRFWSSPAVNAGDNSLLPPDEFDLDGNGDTHEPLPLDRGGRPRVLEGTVDIGAYEMRAFVVVSAGVKMG